VGSFFPDTAGVVNDKKGNQFHNADFVVYETKTMNYSADVEESFGFFSSFGLMTPKNNKLMSVRNQLY